MIYVNRLEPNKPAETTEKPQETPAAEPETTEKPVEAAPKKGKKK